MADAEGKSNIHCLICNSRAGVSIRNAVQIFSDQNKLPTSMRHLHESISEIVQKNISKDIHSHIICKKCYRLFTEYDELQFRMEEIKSDLMEQFKKTLTSYDLQYDTFLPPQVDGKAVEGVPHDAKTSVVEAKSPLVSLLPTVAIGDTLKTMTTLPMNKIRSLPPNVVILSRQGKKIAIQKPAKPISKLESAEEKNEPKPPSGFFILPTPQAENEVTAQPIGTIDPSQTESEETIQLEQQPAAENDSTDQQMMDSDMQIEQQADGGYTDLQTLDYEDAGEDLDHVADDENDNFVISHMEILDGQESSSIELEEGTFLMEQAEDGSIIRVLHHPSSLYNKEDNGEIETFNENDNNSDGDTHYEEIEEEDQSSINLDSVGSNTFIRINKATPAPSRSASYRSTHFVDGEKLDLEQIISPIGGNKYQCLLCETIGDKGRREKQKAEGAEEDQVQEEKDDKDEDSGETSSYADVGKVMEYHLRMVHNVRLHICEVCGEIFRRRSDYTAHSEEHGKERSGVYTCSPCDKTFSSIRQYRFHMKSLHAQQMKQHACLVCSRVFGSRKLLEEHNNTHIGVRPYNCQECGKTFASKYTYQSHLKTHTDRPRPYTCDKCGKSFFTMQNLLQHNKTHLGIKDFVCNICGKAFGTQHNLEVHGVVHTGYKPYVCRTCNKAFARRAEIRDHERTHTGERPYVCDMCGSTFSQRSNLQSHKRATHFDDKRYKCRNCDKRFKRRRLLEYHIKASHTGERPYKCVTCDATFVYPEHFKKHLRIHSGEKPYKCEVCDKAFNSRDNRNAHRFIHSDKKPYECLDCGAGFMRKPLLYAHMQSQGHLSDTIVVNQPRLHGEMETTRLEGLGSTFVLEDGREVIINNIKQEVFSSGQLVTDAVLPQGMLDGTEVEEEEEVGIVGGGTHLLVRTQVKHGHIVIGDEDVDIKGEEEPDGEGDVEGIVEGEDAEGDDDLANSDRIEIISGDEAIPQSLIDGADSSMRFFQIRLPNGEKGWVALNSCEEEQ